MTLHFQIRRMIGAHFRSSGHRSAERGWALAEVIYIYIDTHIHTHIYIYIYTCIHSYIYIYMIIISLMIIIIIISRECTSRKTSFTGICLYKGLPCIRGFPVQGISLHKRVLSGVAERVLRKPTF